MPQRRTSSVLNGPWIPVQWVDDSIEGRPAALGLRELIDRAHEVALIAVTAPPALSALYRVLTALAARVTGLDDGTDWDDRRDELIAANRFPPAETNTYFTRLADRFNLHGERPWMQDPRLAEQCPKAAGVNKLTLGRPSGNNHSWFSPFTDADATSVTRESALLDLLAWLYYGPSGRCSSRTVDGVTKADTKAGPLRSTISYHPVGRTLFETLVAAIPYPGSAPRDPEDLCPWEASELPNPVASTPPTVRGTGSLLTARAQHAVLLVPGADETHIVDAYITWGLRTGVETDRVDPFLLMETSKKGEQYARRASAGRALWRDLDGLVNHAPSSGGTRARPPAIAGLPDIEGLRVQALGFDQDGQAKDTQLVQGLTPQVFDLYQAQDPEYAVRIGDLRRAGETAGRLLEYAAKRAWKDFSDASQLEECAWQRAAGAHYWPTAESLFWQRLADEEFDQLRRAFGGLALDAFDAVTETVGTTLRGAKAVEAARLELRRGL